MFTWSIKLKLAMQTITCLLTILAINGCATANYVDYVVDKSKPTAVVEFWVDQFRNQELIEFSYVDLNDKSDTTTYQKITRLETLAFFKDPIKSSTVTLPAETVFPVYFRFISDSGKFSTRCDGFLPLYLKQGKKYKIEAVNWKPKEAVFSNFTCEFDINEVLNDGTLKHIAYIESKK